MKIVIVIPVYKNPDTDEMVSLRRCCQVLSRYEMALVCPESFDTTVFQGLWKEYGLQLHEDRFSTSYFANIAGYNRLMLSREFYARYADYDYMLIYQPDAYVFEDKLEEWCAKGYGYVGAPLLGEYNQTQYVESMPLHSGNGGFSLRKVSAFIDYFDGSRNVFNSAQILRHIGFKNKPYTRWLVWLLMMCGWHNKPQVVARRYNWNEDCFWSGVLTNSQYPMKQPQPEDALMFAFERFPKEMYEKTGHQLPFGCHAWRKYEYEEFWKGRIV